MASNQIKAIFFPFITTTISTVFLIAFIYSSTYMLGLLNGDMKEGVTVAGISVSELPKDVAKEKIEAEIARWKETTTVSFHYQDKEVTVSASELFFFDVEETLRKAQNTTIVDLEVFVNEELISDTLYKLFNDSKVEQLDRMKLIEDLRKYAQKIMSEDLIINLHDYLEEEIVTISNSEIKDLFFTNNLMKAVLLFENVELKAKEEFSLAEILRKNRVDSIDDQVYSIIATAIYNATLESNFEIRERHISDVLPSYSKLGLEASVDRDKDLKLYNPNATSYTLNVVMTENSIKASVSGVPLDAIYEIEFSNHETTDYETVIENNPNKKGTLVIQEGHQGQKITVHRIRNAGDNERTKEWISDDVYLPVTKIVVRGKQEENKGVKGY